MKDKLETMSCKSVGLTVFLLSSRAHTLSQEKELNVNEREVTRHSETLYQHCILQTTTLQLVNFAIVCVDQKTKYIAASFPWDLPNSMLRGSV